MSRRATRAVIIATLGPASTGPAAVEALRRAGADGVRLNGSHLDAEGLRRFVSAARRGGFRAEQIVLDLQGGKTRVDGLAAPADLVEGMEVLLVPTPPPRQPDPTPVLPVDRPELLQALAPGDTLRLDDGRVALEVTHVSGGTARARALGRGSVSDRKGLALVGREVTVPPRLLGRDLQLVDTARELGIGTLAVSYAATPGVLQAAREAAARNGREGPATLVAKLEQPEALGRIGELVAGSDAVWLCRGDLGAEVGLAALPGLQRRLLDATLGRTTVLVAGQILHHMTVSPRPTRSEVCHAGDLVDRGVAGFVLSDETALGPHGPAAVAVLRQIVEGAERARRRPGREA